jgi:hypothetical protein
MRRQFKSRTAAGCVLVLLALASTARAEATDGEANPAEWRPGEPAPAGYRVTRKHTWTIVGGSMLAGGYAASAVSGFALRFGCTVPAGEGKVSTDCSHQELYDAAPWLFVPIAGPFVALSEHDVLRDGGAVFWFTTFGVAQLAGAALLTYDLLSPSYHLKRDREWAVLTTFGPTTQGVTLRWRR